MTEGVEDQEVSYLSVKHSSYGQIQSPGPCGKEKEFHILPFGKGGLGKSYLLLLSPDLREKHEKKRLEWYDPSVTPE